MASENRLRELLGELQQVLEAERSILLSGAPARIMPIVERKLRLSAEIEQVSAVAGAALPDRETLRRLDRLNRGNAVICAAILRQLGGTLDRLRRGECHCSYRPDGGETIPPAAGRLGAA